MFVFLSKFLPNFVYPLGIIFLILLLAWMFSHRPRIQNALITAVIVLLLVAGNRWVAFSLARSLEWRYLPPDPVPSADVIVVLGGGTESEQYPRPVVEVNSAGDRVLYAARLYKDGKAPRLLLSGGNIDWLNGRTMTPAEEMASILELTGVPRPDMILQPRSQNTREDALFCSQIIKEMGAERVLLVTSAQHMPRSVALFRRQGIEVIPAPVDYTVTQSGWDNLFVPDLQTALVNLVPNVSSMSLVTSVMKEYIGMWVYQLQGWI